MQKRTLITTLSVVLISGAAIVAAQAQNYPLADQVAKKVIQKYQSSSCQQIAQDKQQPPSEMAKKAVDQLRKDPQMRKAFLDQVAPAIVNKLFECGMIP